MGRGGAGVADRLREPGEFSAGPRRPSREREIHHAACAWGSSRTPPSSARSLTENAACWRFTGGGDWPAACIPGGRRALITFVVGKGCGIRPLGATPDLHVLAFTSAICLATGCALSGLAPALRVVGALSAIECAERIGAHSGKAAAERSGRLLPKGRLVVVQVDAVSLVLLAVAGLFCAGHCTTCAAAIWALIGQGLLLGVHKSKVRRLQAAAV